MMIIQIQIWFSKFINIGQIHNFSHSFTSMGSNNTYNKLLSNLIHLLWKILRLSLVSQLYLKLCSFYLIFLFCSRFRPPIYNNSATVVYKSTYFPSFYFNIPLPTSVTPVFYYIGGSFLSNGFHKLIFLCGGRQSKQQNQWDQQSNRPF